MKKTKSTQTTTSNSVSGKRFVSRFKKKEHPNNTHKFFPSFRDASEKAKEVGQGVIYFARGFFGLVWFESHTRYSRDLKNW